MDKTHIESIMSKADWRQRWEILPGIHTPGTSDIDPVFVLDDFGVPKDLAGKSCVDIGAWDGALAFELEKRGGHVIAADIQDPDATAFNTAKYVLGSNVQYDRISIYDMPEKYKGQKFDIIIFRGVYYHLKNPIGAFEAIKSLAANNAIICIEGELMRYYAETTDGAPHRDLMREFADLDVPLTLCYPGTYKNGENWFIPNLACFKGWMKATGLQIVKHQIWEDEDLDAQRIIATATTTDTDIAIEHSVLQKGWRQQSDAETTIVKGQDVHNSRLGSWRRKTGL